MAAGDPSIYAFCGPAPGARRRRCRVVHRCFPDRASKTCCVVVRIIIGAIDEHLEIDHRCAPNAYNDRRAILSSAVTFRHTIENVVTNGWYGLRRSFYDVRGARGDMWNWNTGIAALRRRRSMLRYVWHV